MRGNIARWAACAVGILLAGCTMDDPAIIGEAGAVPVRRPTLPNVAEYHPKPNPLIQATFLPPPTRPPTPLQVQFVQRVETSVPEHSRLIFPVAEFKDQQITGIAVSKEGRVFVCMPRWSETVTMSVAEVKPGGNLQAYPNEDINRWTPNLPPQERLICVQSVYIDDEDNLWILDPASPHMAGVVRNGPKLLKVNLANDTVVQTIQFDAKVAPERSYLNDVRVDTRQGTAYISDSGIGAILVVDLKTGNVRRVLNDHTSTKSEGVMLTVQGHALRLPDGSIPQIHCDGIALDPDGRYLYYHALTARTLYRIDTRYLTDAQLRPPEVARGVERLGEAGPTDGMLMDKEGNLYLTAIEDSAVKVRRPDGKIEIVARDGLLTWPDSLSMGPFDFLYVTTSQIHRMPRFNNNLSVPVEPYRVLKIRLKPGTVDGAASAKQ